MTKNVPSVSRTARAAWGIAKAIGPFAISQVEKASEAYAQHQMRLGQVEACKELMIGEIRTLNEVRRKLVEKFYDLPEEERFRVKRDLQDLERETCRLGVYQRALEYLPKDDGTAPSSSGEVDSTESISPSWIDRFDEVARLQNEAWRRELLSRALSREAQNPGSISPRALWFIGTIDDRIFHAYASLIDISSKVMGRYIVPNAAAYLERIVPNCALGDNYRVGNLAFLVNDVGVIGDVLSSQRLIPPNAIYQLKYGTQYVILTTKQEMRVGGIMPTELGDVIASLYEPKPNELGTEIFNAWVKSIGPPFGEIQQGT